MNLLIVGAGAVGSSYGYFASLAGANVTYLAKPKYRASLENGLTLYHWRGRAADTIAFRGFAVIDDLKAIDTKSFDAVLITLPSDKLKSGDWFEKLLPHVGNAAIWSLQSNTSDVEWIAEKIGANAYERLVWGRIPIMSYLAPLPGESFDKTGYAYYIPPGAKALWTAKDPKLASTAAKLFSAGGLPSRVSEKDFRTTGLLEESLLRMVVAGLERSEWSMDRLFNGANLYLVREGIREATAILSKRYETRDPAKKVFGKFASSVLGLRFIARAAKALIPFELEAFLRIHFTKVEDQMHEGLDELISQGKQSGSSTTNLTLLRGRVK